MNLFLTHTHTCLDIHTLHVSIVSIQEVFDSLNSLGRPLLQSSVYQSAMSGPHHALLPAELPLLRSDMFESTRIEHQ